MQHLTHVMQYIKDQSLLCGGLAGCVAIGTVYLLRRYRNPDSSTPPKVYDPGTGRPLGTVEKLILSGCDRGNAMLGHVISIGTKQPMNEEKLREVLTRLCQIHPLLRMKVGYKGGQPWYVELNKIIVPLTVLDTTDWKSVLEDDLLVNFDTATDKPLWRMFYLPKATLGQSYTHPYHCVMVLTLNHVIIDGVSYMRLIDDILKVMEEVTENKPRSLERLPMCAPIDEYVEPTLNESLVSRCRDIMYRFLVNYTPMRSLLLKPWLTPLANAWVQKFGIEKMRDPTAPTKTCIEPFCLSKEDTSALLQRCKEHRVTVQAALQTAGSFAASQLYSELDPKDQAHHLEVLSSVPINVREQFGHVIGPRHLGCYMMVCVYGTSVPPKPRDADHFWSVATNIHQSIRHQVNNKVYMWYYSLAKARNLLNISQAELDTAAEEHRATGLRFHTILLFTNLGNCSYLDRDDQCPVKLLARYGTSAEHNVGSIFDNNLVTFEGQLFWNMSYFPNITTKAVFDKYADYTKNYLQKMISKQF